MKTFFPFIIVIILTVCSVSGNCSDSSKIFLKANHHLWMRTSYNNSSFKTLDYHFLFLPNTRKCALELDLYYYVESKKRFQRMLEEYSGKEQPFPYGLESLRAKLHLKDININNNWLKINKLTIGNFLQNRARYEYLNFSRYVLHSPLDIEQKRSLADWGFYSNVQMWKFNVEGFLLHSFKKDHTVGFQTNIEFSLSPKVTFIPILNGVFDSRTDENYNLHYPLGTDNTLSCGCDIQFYIKNNKLYVKPLIAYNTHNFLNASPNRYGYLRNTELALITPPFFQLPLLKQLLDTWGIYRWGVQLDGILENNDAGYHPNFAYGRDEINDDFFHRMLATDGANAETPGFLYNREFVNIRIGEMGGEIGVRFQGYNLSNCSNSLNIFNLGTKLARYSRIGEKHEQSYDDFWLVESDFRTFTRDICANIAYWRRKTNIVRDPDLNELKMSTWIAGVHYILHKGIMFNFKKHDTKDQIVFSAFFRTDNFIEKYEKESCKYRGSIFMAALYMPVFRYDKYLTTLQVLYRKYVPDNHIIERIFPPNNVIRVSLNLSAAW